MVYIALGKEKAKDEFAFCFWYRAHIELKSCRGREIR